MHRECACRYCKSQSLTGCPLVLARCIHAVERLEDQAEVLVRNSGTRVVHGDLHGIWQVLLRRAARADHHDAPRGTEAHGIAHHILEGAAQELHIAVHQ